MDVTIPLENLTTESIQSLKPGTLFYRHDGYRLGTLCMRIDTPRKAGAYGFVMLNGEQAFDVYWCRDDSGEDVGKGVLAPVDQLCVTLTTDSYSGANHETAGNLFSASTVGKSWFLAKDPKTKKDEWIEILSGSATFEKPKNSALLSTWSLISRSPDGKDTVLFEVTPPPPKAPNVHHNIGR